MNKMLLWSLGAVVLLSACNTRVATSTQRSSGEYRAADAQTVEVDDKMLEATLTPLATSAQPIPKTMPPTSRPVQSADSSTSSDGENASAQSSQPVIHALTVLPMDGSSIMQQEHIDVAWRAEGASASLCIGIVGSRPSCVPVATTGSQGFPFSAKQGVLFVMLQVGDDVNLAESPNIVSEKVEIELGCADTWAFAGLQVGEHCPGPEETWNAVAQPFEYGWMIWNGSRYLILADQPHEQGRLIEDVYDPLTVDRDTSDQHMPPGGLLVPESGIGIVWRGDAAESRGYQDVLGWAKRAEFTYQATYQCWSLGETGAWEAGEDTCYLTHPSGGVIEIVHSGAVYYWSMYE